MVIGGLWDESNKKISIKKQTVFVVKISALLTQRINTITTKQRPHNFTHIHTQSSTEKKYHVNEIISKIR